MNPTDPHNPEVIGVPGIGSDTSNGKPADANRCQSPDGQRIAELERQLAAVSTQNAELVRANRELEDVRRQLQGLLDNIPDRIYFKDTRSRFLRLNQALARRLGVSDPEQAVGKTDFDFQLPERAKEFYTDEQRIMQTGEALINKTEKQIMPDGKTAWTATTKVPLRDPDGGIIGLVGINRDITQQKQAEAGQAYEEELFHNLLDTIPDNIYFKDRESRIVRVSRSKVESTLKSTRKLYRAAHPNDNPDEWPPHLADVKAFSDWLIGKTDFDTFPEEHARTTLAQEQEILRTGQPIVGKLEKTTHTDGSSNWWLTTKLPWRNKDGDTIGIFGVTRNVTEIKETEEALSRERLLLRALVDNLPDAIYAKDTAGRKTLANPADLKNLRCKTETEAIGKNDFDLFPKDLAEKFWSDDLKVIAGDPVINREEYFLDDQGRQCWLLTSKLPLRDVAGKIVGLIGIGRDITLQKQAEEALRGSKEKLRQFAARLERSNRELQDFAYVASHDLQEPLRKIVVFGERLKEKNADKFGPESVDYLDRMQKAAGRMQTLITDLLTFSRVTTKAQPFMPVNLAEVAAGVATDLEGRIEMVKGRVEVSTLPVIDAEPVQMRQLLQNLIGNALKFRRPEEPPVVKVEAQLLPDPAAPDKQLCRLTVSDNCIGFDEKYLDRIFNVFQRLHTRNEYEGTGMGLAIVKKIALYHGGDITAKSKPGEGSTFILTVPASHPQKTQDETANNENPPS
jgi:two-component system, sensor histidine kinase and response regulator